MHLAVAAIVNALWDLWARLENQPLWRLLTDMDPEASVPLYFRHVIIIESAKISESSVYSLFFICLLKEKIDQNIHLATFFLKYVYVLN